MRTKKGAVRAHSNGWENCAESPPFHLLSVICNLSSVINCPPETGATRNEVTEGVDKKTLTFHLSPFTVSPSHQSSDCFSLMSKANNSVLRHLSSVICTPSSVLCHLAPPLFYSNLRRCKNLCLLPRDMGLLCNDLKENGLQANDNKTNNIRQR